MDARMGYVCSTENSIVEYLLVECQTTKIHNYKYEKSHHLISSQQLCVRRILNEYLQFAFGLLLFSSHCAGQG